MQLERIENNASRNEEKFSLAATLKLEQSELNDSFC